MFQIFRQKDFKWTHTKVEDSVNDIFLEDRYDDIRRLQVQSRNKVKFWSVRLAFIKS